MSDLVRGRARHQFEAVFGNRRAYEREYERGFKPGPQFCYVDVLHHAACLFLDGDDCANLMYMQTEEYLQAKSITSTGVGIRGTEVGFACRLDDTLPTDMLCSEEWDVQSHLRAIGALLAKEAGARKTAAGASHCAAVLEARAQTARNAPDFAIDDNESVRWERTVVADPNQLHWVELPSGRILSGDWPQHA